jgi:hypothetical protein
MYCAKNVFSSTLVVVRTLTEEEKAWIAGNPKICISCLLDYMPNKVRKRKGFGTDVCKTAGIVQKCNCMDETVTESENRQARRGEVGLAEKHKI